MLAPGTTLRDRYQLEERLGRTAAGRQTWRVRDLNTAEAAIVKLLAFSPQMEWQELELFEREAKTLQSLQHGRIPHYRDYFDLSADEGAVCPGSPWCRTTSTGPRSRWPLMGAIAGPRPRSRRSRGSCSTS